MDYVTLTRGKIWTWERYFKAKFSESLIFAIDCRESNWGERSYEHLHLMQFGESEKKNDTNDYISIVQIK